MSLKISNLKVLFQKGYASKMICRTAKRSIYVSICPTNHEAQQSVLKDTFGL